MIIDAIELYLVKNHFHTPWRTAYGEDPGNCVMMTRMVSGNYEGWSESSPLPGPFYSYEYGEGIYNVTSRFLAPMLIGKEMASAEEVFDALSAVKGNPFAKAGLEIAWWTLKADMEGLPLHRLLSSQSGDIVEEGASIGVCDSYEELIKQIGSAFDSGAKRVKLKAMHGWDVEMIRVVRETFPSQIIHIDCNASYSIEEADIFRKLDRYGLAMIEQPFASSDIIHHAKLQAMLETPLCLDESIVDSFVAEQALELKACRYMNLKPARMGGLSHALKVNQLCKEAGIGCWVGGMLESDVGKAICVELASIENMTYPHDVTPESDNYPEPIAERALTHCGPWKFPVSTQVGTPIKPDMEKMRAKTISHIRLEGI